MTTATRPLVTWIVRSSTSRLSYSVIERAYLSIVALEVPDNAGSGSTMVWPRSSTPTIVILLLQRNGLRKTFGHDN
jgi:hypothetical protein